jgi:hypothetical protein
VVFEGTPRDLVKARTLTGAHLAAYLNGRQGRGKTG